MMHKLMNDTTLLPDDPAERDSEASSALFNGADGVFGSTVAMVELAHRLYAIRLAVDAAQKLLSSEPAPLPELLSFISEQAEASYTTLSDAIAEA